MCSETRKNFYRYFATRHDTDAFPGNMWLKVKPRQRRLWAKDVSAPRILTTACTVLYTLSTLCSHISAVNTRQYNRRSQSWPQNEAIVTKSASLIMKSCCLKWCSRQNITQRPTRVTLKIYMSLPLAVRKHACTHLRTECVDFRLLSWVDYSTKSFPFMSEPQKLGG